MTELKDKVSARLVENETLVCIHNVRYYDGDDMGGILYFDIECLDWLIEQVSAWLEGYRKVEETNSYKDWPERTQRSFSNDDLRVKESGREPRIHLAISNHRNEHALHGGVTVEAMDPDVGADLLLELKSVREVIRPK